MNPNIIRAVDFENKAVKYIAKIANKSIAERGKFIISLCGGKTPRPVYEKLAHESNLIDWSKTYITFGDERCVPPEHPDSNFGMINNILLKRVNISRENIHRIKGELAVDVCAREYQDEIENLEDGSLLKHDLILLGIGSDGHTASLFPKSRALDETERLVVHNYVEKLDSYRITFTYPLINNARNICFLINDKSKKNILESVLKKDSRYPASLVQPKNGHLDFIVSF